MLEESCSSMPRLGYVGIERIAESRVGAIGKRLVRDDTVRRIALRETVGIAEERISKIIIKDEIQGGEDLNAFYAQRMAARNALTKKKR